MAAAIDFRNALDRCGFDADTRTFASTQGITTAEDFSLIPHENLDETIKTLRKVSEDDDDVTFGLLSCLRLKGLRFHVDYRLARGQTIDLAGFAGAMLRNCTQRMQEIEREKQEDQDDTELQTRNLDNMSDWRVF